MELKDVLASFDVRKFASIGKKPEQPANCIKTNNGAIVSTDATIIPTFVNYISNNSEVVYTGSYNNIDNFKENIGDIIDDYKINHVFIEARHKNNDNDFYIIEHRYLVFGKDQGFVEQMKEAILSCISQMTSLNDNIYAHIEEEMINRELKNQEINES